MNKTEKAMPQEIGVWYILPTIRKELALALKSQGLKQKEIAEKLGITNAAISQYLKNKRASNVKFNDETMKAIQMAAKNIKNNSNVVKEILQIEKSIKKSKVMCKMCLNSKGGCNICCKP